MKRILGVIMLFLAFSSTQAQLVRGYGIKTGATFSNQNRDFNPATSFRYGSDYRNGINCGFFIEFLDNPILSIVTEANYVQKGYVLDIMETTPENPTGTGNLISQDQEVDYINLSALGKLRINLGIVSPYVIAGPKIDFEINNTTDYEFNKTTYGAKIGIGSEFDLVAINLLVEVLYDFDLNKLLDNEFLKTNSKSFDLRVGVMF